MLILRSNPSLIRMCCSLVNIMDVLAPPRRPETARHHVGGQMSQITDSAQHSNINFCHEMAWCGARAHL